MAQSWCENRLVKFIFSVMKTWNAPWLVSLHHLVPVYGILTSRKAVIDTNFLSNLVWFDEEIEPMFVDFEVDALRRPCTTFILNQKNDSIDLWTQNLQQVILVL